MSLILDAELARARFAEAGRLADAGTLPLDWIDRIRKLGTGPQRTFIAFLGTGLLAKATDPRVDVFAVSLAAGPTGYSARTFCSNVLVPLAFKSGVDLGATGDDPLANQPFFRYPRLEPGIRVRSVSHLDYLLDCLGVLSQLDTEGATHALAAYIQVRREKPPALSDLSMPVLAMGDLVDVTSLFVTEKPETGRRGQAFVAAALDLVYPDVRTARVNDPSRRLPGDVHILPSHIDDAIPLVRQIVMAVEVRQKVVSIVQIRQFAARLGRDGITRGAIALLDPRQPAPSIEDLLVEILADYGVHFHVFESVADVLQAAMFWSPRSLSELVLTFPTRMSDRLHQIGVAPSSLVRWHALMTRVVAS